MGSKTTSLDSIDFHQVDEKQRHFYKIYFSMFNKRTSQTGLE